MNSVGVFCGSSFGADPGFAAAAQLLGSEIAKAGKTLVYGGANVGLMGAVASAALASGGKVIGVLPKFLADKEIAHNGLTELVLCDTMHERKMKMFELSQGFIAMPGGFGTLDEVCEILTWGQLGLHQFPVGFLNVNGFYDHLSRQLATMESAQLLKPEHRKMAIFEVDAVHLLHALDSYAPPAVTKWISKQTT